MGWGESEESIKQRGNAGRYFKLQDDGDQARLVLLTEPDEQEKDGASGVFTVYSLEIWNVDAGKRQTWDMGASQFRSLLGLKRALGLAKLYSNELIVVRNGRKGDTAVSYTWTPDGKIGAGTLEAMAEAGVATAPMVGAPERQAQAHARPAPVQAPAKVPAGPLGPGPKGALDMMLTGTLADLRMAFEAAWNMAGPADQDELQNLYQQRKAELEAQAPISEAPSKRKPAF